MNSCVNRHIYLLTASTYDLTTCPWEPIRHTRCSGAPGLLWHTISSPLDSWTVCSGEQSSSGSTISRTIWPPVVNSYLMHTAAMHTATCGKHIVCFYLWWTVDRIGHLQATLLLHRWAKLLCVCVICQKHKYNDYVHKLPCRIQYRIHEESSSIASSQSQCHRLQFVLTTSHETRRDDYQVTSLQRLVLLQTVYGSHVACCRIFSSSSEAGHLSPHLSASVALSICPQSVPARLVAVLLLQHLTSAAENSLSLAPSQRVVLMAKYSISWLGCSGNSQLSNQIQTLHLRDISRCEGHARWVVLDCSDVRHCPAVQ